MPFNDIGILTQPPREMKMLQNEENKVNKTL